VWKHFSGNQLTIYVNSSSGLGFPLFFAATMCVRLEAVAKKNARTCWRSNLGHAAHSLVTILTELSSSFYDYHKTESRQAIMVTD
jgi:hypothetical protein